MAQLQVVSVLLSPNKSLSIKITGLMHKLSGESTYAKRARLEKDETGISYIIFQCAPTTPTLEAFKENVLHLL